MISLHCVSSSLESSPAARYLPTVHGVQTLDTTCSFSLQRIASHVVSGPLELSLLLLYYVPLPQVILVAIHYGYFSWRQARGRCPGQCARLRRGDLRRSDTMPCSTARERHETPRFGTPRDTCPSMSFHGRRVAPHCVCALPCSSRGSQAAELG